MWILQQEFHHTIDTIWKGFPEMRELVRYEAECRRAVGLSGRLTRIFANRRTRNDLRRLQAMNEFALRDIGLTPDDVRYLLRLPHSVDLRWEADRLRLGNAKHSAE
jgi:uncharacterized protein YjiS (DUF1127 family)